MYDSMKYNITVDHENGVCNVIFGALNPFFTGDALTYYTYDEKTRYFEEHRIEMKDCIAVSLLKVGQESNTAIPKGVAIVVDDNGNALKLKGINIQN